MFSPLAVTAAVLLLLGVVSYVLTYKRQSVGRLYPPGPKPRPIMGNYRDIPRARGWLTYTQWKEQYGDIIYLSLFRGSMLILNSIEVVNDLLDKRGTIYSDRPRFSMANELMGWEWALSLMPYGNRFFVHRRIVQQQFQASVVVQSYHPIISTETRLLLAKLADRPDEFIKHLQHTANAIIMMVTYGHEVASADDEFVLLAEEVRNVNVMAGKKGPYLVDIFPFLKHVPMWFPGARFKRNAHEWKKVIDEMRRRPYQMVKQQMAAGTAGPSILASLLRSGVTTGCFDREETIMNCAGVVFGAGAETTFVALTNFCLAMQLYPDVQKKAQKEIDNVTEGRRLPQFTDRDAMPYIDAIVKENTRWHPVTPLGVPHRTTRDDNYNGMFIPRYSTVIANVWAILQDPMVYQNPEKFTPERFLPSDSSPLGAPDPARAAFGFGRRVCPGRYLADSTIWLVIARVLAIFDITPALDEAGGKVVPTVKWSSGPVSVPSPFKCNIKPRSAAVLGLI